MRKGRQIPGLVVLAMMTLLVAAPAALQLRILWLKHGAAERMEQASLKTIHLSKSDVHWEEKGKELRIGKRLFDVESFRETEQELIAKGIFDDEETSIEAKANAFWEKGDPRQTGFLVKYFQLLNGACFMQNTWQLRAFITGMNDYPDTLFYRIKIIYLSIPSPPPQKPGSVFYT